MAQQSTEYGKRSGGSSHSVRAFPVGASEVFKKKGGGFVIEDNSGRVEIATAAATNILGWALIQEDFTASSTEGGTIVPVDMDLDAIYEVPINTGTWADTYRGESCDISISSNIQGANLSGTSTKVLTLIDKGFTNAAGTVVSVLVKLNRAVLTVDAAA